MVFIEVDCEDPRMSFLLNSFNSLQAALGSDDISHKYPFLRYLVSVCALPGLGVGLLGHTGHVLEPLLH